MKDNLLFKLRRWIDFMRMLNNGENPPVIPLTKEEVSVLRDNFSPGEFGHRLGDWRHSQVMGIEARQSAFAICMRERMIEMPITRLEERIEQPLREALEIRDWRDHATDRLYRSMIARVCTDTTRLFMTFEFDPLAKLKRAFRITKWFPVKTRTVAVEGTVLYPYLNVTLPHNTHYVRFALAPL